MAFIRRVRTKSGATAVQIAEYAQGRQRIVKHLGSAHTEAELGVLLARARELLEDPAQGTLELDVQPAPVAASLVRPAPEPALFDPPGTASPQVRGAAGRVVGTDSRVLFEALAAVYAQLGFDVVGDEVFADLVIARVVEPTSLLDVARVLGDLGQEAASYKTMGRTLARAQERGYRDLVAGACFEHAVSTGDVSLIMYDVTTLYFEAEKEDDLRKGRLFELCRGLGYAEVVLLQVGWWLVSGPGRRLSARHNRDPFSMSESFEEGDEVISRLVATGPCLSSWDAGEGALLDAHVGV